MKIQVDASMRKKILASFQTRAFKGRSLSEVYRAAIIADFGGVIARDERGRPMLKSEDGSPIPSLRQYTYCVVKEIGRH